VRALSIMQPWADAIVLGTKRVENRSWQAPHWIAGQEIALHASRRPDSGAEPPPGEQWPVDLIDRARFGAVLGVATIIGCHPQYHICNPTGIPATVCSPWAVWGQCHWILENVRLLAEPVPCKGALGLWRLPEDVEAAVRAQLPAREQAGA
jgi:hypothetical protein